jgi:hypothetical protein
MTTRGPATGARISLGPGIEDRLERLSTLMDVPPLTLASHAIQSWVAEQERTLALIESLGDDVGGEMGSYLKKMLRAGLYGRQQILDGPELTEGEVDAIAEQEGLSMAASAGLGSALLQSREGLREIERLIHENAKEAKAQGQSEKAEHLEGILIRFKKAHPFWEG